jgi:hypothetical protein
MFFMKGSIEEAMFRIVERKAKLAEVCMTRKKGGSMAQKSDLAELVKLFTDKKKSTSKIEELEDEEEQGEETN